MATFTEFFNYAYGKSWDTNGTQSTSGVVEGYPNLGGQCVSLVKTYLKFLGYENKAYGNAADWWTNRNQNGILKVCSVVTKPANGDIVVSQGADPAYGHIFIYKDGKAFAQNVNGDPYAKIWPMSIQGKVMGYLRPKCLNTTGTKEESVKKVNLKKTLQGIDISHYQPNIDLSKVEADFVIVKATEGTWYTDPYCDKHISAAKKNKKLIGAYHYANGGDYRAEADYFLKKVDKYLGEAVLVLDWEGQGNQMYGVNDLTWCKNWLNYVYKKTGVKPMLYCSQSIMARFQNVGDYGLWIAQYPNYEPTGYQEHPWNEGRYTCAMRQYTSAGRLKGFSGNLDLDKFYGDAEAWKKYAKGTMKTEPAKPAVTPTPNKKSVYEVAREVINGKWGNGDDRKKRLQKAGYTYSEVQKQVNQILAESNKPAKKSVKEIAKEVWAGKWGNGTARRNALRAAGYSYEEVQKAVNNMK